MDINNPSLNLNEDVKTDDSFKQSETTIHLEGGSQYIQNSGNEKKQSTSPLWKVLFVSIVCDVLLGLFLYTSTDNALSRIDAQVESHKAETDKMMEQAREGNIWLIRYDLIRAIDLYEVRGQLTPKEYTRLKDEFQYYREVLKGNHDVQERWDEFNVKIFGTREIKLSEQIMK